MSVSKTYSQIRCERIYKFSNLEKLERKLHKITKNCRWKILAFHIILRCKTNRVVLANDENKQMEIQNKRGLNVCKKVTKGGRRKIILANHWTTNPRMRINALILAFFIEIKFFEIKLIQSNYTLKEFTYN